MPGGSWKTGIVGWILVASGSLGLLADIIAKQGIPDTVIEWVSFGTAFASGIAALLAKDYDKSNAPSPVAEAKTVPPAPGG